MSAVASHFFTGRPPSLPAVWGMRAAVYHRGRTPGISTGCWHLVAGGWTLFAAMRTIRKELLDRLVDQPRSVSALARELGLTRRDVEDDLVHALRSAEAAGYRVDVIPARCR